MIVGAPHRADLIGRAFLYQKNQAGAWKLVKVIRPKEETWTADFGSKVVINDHHILIADRLSNNEKGAVFAMNMDAETGDWENNTTLTYKNIIDHGLLGHSIALHNNNVVIGSRNGNVAIEYDYNSIKDQWEEKNVFTPTKYQSKARYGLSLIHI